MEDQMATPAPATFAQLLERAVNEPGILSSAYRQFYGYSLGNVLLALSQCLARGIQPGPIATFQRWKELGRFVRRGEKAITLCRPVIVKRTTTADDGTDAIKRERDIIETQSELIEQSTGKKSTRRK
jgi:antirestriction protein ArdC